MTDTVVVATPGGPAERKLPADCPGQAIHRPAPLRLVTHHVVPQSWGGRTEPGNLVDLCDNCHYGTHCVLDAFLRAGRELSRPEVRVALHLPEGWPLPRLHYELAVRGWRGWHDAGRPRPATQLREMFPDHHYPTGEPTHVH
jgi:hypothetical protein